MDMATGSDDGVSDGVVSQTCQTTDSDDGHGVTSISGETLAKAKKELREVPEKRLEAIEEMSSRLHQWTPSVDDPHEQGLTLTRVDDDKFLLSFLRAKKFDMDRSVQMFVNYHKYRKKYANILGEISFEAAKPVLERGLISVLPHRSRNGCKVIIANADKIDFDEISMNDGMKAFLVVLDKLLEDEETQVHGLEFFENLEGFSLLKVLSMARTEQVARGVMIELIQEAFPARFKGMHLVNQPWYVSIVMAIVKPFMKQKLKDRIHLHGADFSSLHEFLPPEHLPAEFEGQLSSLASYNALHLFQESSQV